MKKLFAILILLCGAAIAQNVRYDNIAYGPRGPVPFASVAACSQPANTTSAPCSPLASLCSSLTDTVCSQPNPITADALGNFHFYIKSTSIPFTVQIYGPQVSAPYVLADQGQGILPSGTILATNGAQSVDTFGDSITQGTGATTFMAPGLRGQQTCWQGDVDYAQVCYGNGPTAYAYLLNADFGNAGHNYGRGGDMSTDMSWHVAIWAHPTLQGNPARTGMIGTNDNSLCGTVSNCQDTTTKAELFAAAQATIPDSLKVLASSCSTTGVWSPGDISGSMVTTTSGSTLTCTSTSSTAFTYIAYEKCDNTSNGTASVTVNGSSGSIEPTLSFFGLGSSNIFWTNGTSFASGSGQFSHCTLALARNGGVAGSNTTVITSTNTGRVEVYWVGGPFVASPSIYAPPLWVIGGVPYENGNAGQPGVGQYNTIATNVYNTMLADGNNVKFANVQSYMNFTTDFTGGGGNGPAGVPWAASWNLPLHPGDSGHYHIFQAFRDQLTPLLNPPQVMTLWAGPSGSISSANSTGGQFGADGGLNAVQANANLTISQTGNKALSSLNLSSSGANQITFGQWGTGQGNGLPGVSGLFDSTKTFMTWNTNANGDFCLTTPITYGAQNVAQCAGSTFYVQGGLLNAATRLGIQSNTPGVYNGLGAAGGEVILQIDAQAAALNPALVLQSNNASANPYVKLINKQGGSNQKDWSLIHRTSPLEFAIDLCPDAETTCSTTNDIFMIANATGLVAATKGFQSAGTAATLGGTGACSTRSSQLGGSTAGQVQCIGGTAASTLVITPGATAPNGWSCWASDKTTTLSGSISANSTTSCTMSFTSVTANDVVVFGAIAY